MRVPAFHRLRFHSNPPALPVVKHGACACGSLVESEQILHGPEQDTTETLLECGPEVRYALPLLPFHNHHSEIVGKSVLSAPLPEVSHQLLDNALRGFGTMRSQKGAQALFSEILPCVQSA